MNARCDEVTTISSNRFSFWVLAILVLGMAAATRFYALGAPSLWNDEIYNFILVGRMPWDFISEWAMRFEIQPPYPEYAFKIVMAMGHDDFVLRLPFALFGVLAVYRIFKYTSRYWGMSAGYLAALLVAFNPLMILMSRSARPYSLVCLLFILSIEELHGLLRKVQSGCQKYWLSKEFLLIFFWYTLLLMLHYSSILMVFSELFAVLLFALFYKNKEMLRFFMLLVCVSLLAFLPTAPFFYKGMLATGYMRTQHSMFGVGKEVFAIFISLFRYGNGEIISWLMLLTVGIYLYCLFRQIIVSKKYLLLLFPVLIITPLVAIVLRRYDSHMTTRHFLFLLYPAAVVIGVGFSRLNKVVVVPVLAILTIFLVYDCAYNKYDMYYVHSAVNEEIKDAAKIYTFKADKTAAVYFGGDYFSFNALSWYVGQYQAVNTISHQSVVPIGKRNLLFVEKKRGENEFVASQISNLAPYRQHIFYGGDYKFISYIFGYEPLFVDKHNATAILNAQPYIFYSHVATVNNVQLFSDKAGGARIIPTINGTWTEFTLAIENKEKSASESAVLFLDYLNQGVGNLIKVLYSYDDAPYAEAFTSRGKDPSERAVLVLPGENGWKRLRLTVKMNASEETAYPGGGNLPLVGIRSLRLSVCPADKGEACRRELYEEVTGDTKEHASYVLTPERVLPDGPRQEDWLRFYPSYVDIARSQGTCGHSFTQYSDPLGGSANILPARVDDKGGAKDVCRVAWSAEAPNAPVLHRACNVFIDSRYGLGPRVEGTPSFVEFRYDGKQARPGSAVRLLMDFSTVRDPGEIRVAYAFDDAPWAVVFETGKARRAGLGQFHLPTPKRWDHLKIRVQFAGSVLGKSGHTFGRRACLYALNAYIERAGCDDRGDDLLQLDAQAINTKQLCRTMPIGFKGSVSAETGPIRAENAELIREGEHQFYRAVDSRSPAYLTVPVAAACGELVFYPRLSGRDSLVHASWLDKAGGMAGAMRGIDGVWTPIGLRVPLQSSGRTGTTPMRIMLLGKGAQLYTGEDGAVVFCPGKP